MQPPRPLLYSEYINDRAIVEALRMSPAPEGVPEAKWPRTPEGWEPGDPWPCGANWCHDEVLFIRTHQAFEVWFALILHEVGAVVSEAASLVSPEAALAGADLGARTSPSARLPLGADWPVTGKAIANASAVDPGAREALVMLGPPGRFGSACRLPTGMGVSDRFHQALVLWTHRLNRASAALLCTLPFFDVLATMTPAEFLRFRDRLQPASGFGSVQFRELELLAGLKELHQHKLRPEGGSPDGDGSAPPPPPPLLRPTAKTPSHQRAMSFYNAQPPWGWARVAKRASQPSLRDVVYALLGAAHAAGSLPDGPEKGLPDLRPASLDAFVAGVVSRTLDDHYRAQPARKLDDAGRQQLSGALAALDDALSHRETLVAAFIEMHPAQERFAQFLQAGLDLDAALLRWRDRHIRFVESIIGMRRGTGGGGIQYLRTTTSPAQAPAVTHALPCLWQARSLVQNPA